MHKAAHVTLTLGFGFWRQKHVAACAKRPRQERPNTTHSQPKPEPAHTWITWATLKTRGHCGSLGHLGYLGWVTWDTWRLDDSGHFGHLDQSRRTIARFGHLGHLRHSKLVLNTLGNCVTGTQLGRQNLWDPWEIWKLGTLGSLVPTLSAIRGPRRLWPLGTANYRKPKP